MDLFGFGGEGTVGLVEASVGVGQGWREPSVVGRAHVTSEGLRLIRSRRSQVRWWRIVSLIQEILTSTRENSSPR